MLNDPSFMSMGDCRVPVEQMVFSGASEDQNKGPVTPVYPNFLTSTVLPSSARGWRKVLCEHSDQTGVTEATATTANGLNILTILVILGNLTDGKKMCD